MEWEPSGYIPERRKKSINLAQLTQRLCNEEMDIAEKISAVFVSTMKAAIHKGTDSARSVVKTGANTAAGAAQRVAGVLADPTILANLVIAATAAQEKVNEILQRKQSIYRIADVRITVGLPPQVTFAISRLGDPEALSSSDLIGDLEELESQE